MPIMYKSPSSRILGGNGMLYATIGFASFLVFLYMSFGDLWFNLHGRTNFSFVKRNGTQFIVDGRPFYFNGWNSYWMMDHAVDESRRPRIREMLQTGAKMGLTVCRTWAFNDGAYNALQISPGRFDEKVFRALDYVIAEANQQGIRLILSLVNNLQAYGGKTQYVKWAWEEGVALSSSNDSFFYDPSIRHYFKNYVKTVLTRKNTITGIEYRDDPTIFAWELINEPRCLTDPSGDTLQDWIEEMSYFVKSIDRNHLLTVGLEGFYGPKNSKRLSFNPEFWAADLGSDFTRNSMISTIDFASVHIYPDHWSHVQNFEYNLRFVSKWMISHIEDGDKDLKKPIMFTEFGLSNEDLDFDPSLRERFYKVILDISYKSAKRNKSGAGTLVWQFLVEGMEEFNDEFGIVPWKRPSTYQLFTEQSCRLARIQGALPSQEKHLKKLCGQR
ncbi:mannan endo-1,4-beta-mannosidase 2-like [Olea europaea var. sylvestris]|uniref:mannan endo-1,4-beta-mannosidase n=1 Tax=Olea europaea subsp. europaea TaxID=158383 RepID=A0A8S0S4Z6_OLEEU|nr:mannan endo-1,4-beta-mannosidase 2-like [Olea europaea var. sylvestris]CAA2986783.1 mannan endo-1,4-beta-mannosidase 2-like [Olea europaea subsp. europaea]